METLTFCKPGNAQSLATLDFPTLQSSLVENYPAAIHLPIIHIAQFGGMAVHGFAGVERVGGVFVQPAHSVLGLRAWDDALEGVLPGGAPWVLFEAEKIVRMMLRQSGLALEILASPVGGDWGVDFDARVLVCGAITREIVLYYRDVTRVGVSRLLALVESGRIDDPCLEDGRGWLQDLFRHLLTGCVLGQQGHVCLHLEHLLDLPVAEGVREPLDSLVGGRGDGLAIRELGVQAVRLQGFLEVEQACALPERPSDYDGLNDWLVTQRLVAGNVVGRRNGR